jgi:uncharacterized protein (DUF1778 family)
MTEEDTDMGENNVDWAADKKIVPLQVKTTMEEAERIRQAAETENKSITQFVLDAIRMEMARLAR